MTRFEIHIGWPSFPNDFFLFSWIDPLLQIKSHVVVQEEYSTIAPPYCDYVLHLRIEDSCRADISGPCNQATEFIQSYLENDLPVLVWSKNETSRATAIGKNSGMYTSIVEWLPSFYINL